MVNRTSFASCRASAAKSVMRMELVIRLDYGSVVPWMRRMDGHLRAIGGPDALSPWTDVATHGRNLTTEAEFLVRAGDRVPFLLMWHPSHSASPPPFDAMQALEDTQRWWEDVPSVHVPGSVA